MNQHRIPALPSGDASAWEQALYAFLVEKGNRSGSRRTVESYGRMLWPFLRGRIPDQVRPAEVLAYALGIGLSGRPARLVPGDALPSDGLLLPGVAEVERLHGCSADSGISSRLSWSTHGASGTPTRR